ncbi:DUF268 domain-containing protein [Agrobacterium cavarae]|uniref:DUF268 domain-containing protein n=1 Tax=Agrobacterium cavarae TaxID=2528239 RepID=UPI0028B1C41A|nr:DUF268 domain-containing protein [Agrobacterium cavarae]
MGLRKFLKGIGFDYYRMRNLKNLPRFYREKRRWIDMGGTVTGEFRILADYEDGAGVASGHYFHQDLLVAQYVFSDNPQRHIDVGSRIDGFVAHVASFRQIEIFDVRPLPSFGHPNIVFKQADLMDNCPSDVADSVSCLHAIEHFGLGRYGDPIDPNGSEKGIKNLVKMLKTGGTLYISFPIGAADAVYFNAHRVFHPLSILNNSSVKKSLQLLSFDYVGDDGNLYSGVDPSSLDSKIRYGCGIYRFRKLDV